MSDAGREAIYTAAFAAYEASVPRTYRYSAEAIRAVVDAVLALSPTDKTPEPMAPTAWRYRVFLHELTGEPVWSNWKVSDGPGDPGPSIGGRYESQPLYAASPLREGGDTFQQRVAPWMQACFGPEISADRLERNDRFMEEALELVQATGYPKERAYALIEYVYGRDQGEINQEVGGVMVTLAAHCLAHGVDMHAAAETELARIWTKVEKIRAKQAAKPTGSALPVAVSAIVSPELKVTEEMVTRAMDRAAWTVKATPAEYEGGGLIDPGMSQEEADHLNAQLRVEMREILLAAIGTGADEPPPAVA